MHGNPASLSLLWMTVLVGCHVGPSGRVMSDIKTSPIGGPFAERSSKLINDQWRFTGDDAPDANGAGFDDKMWEAVTLPHTWNAVDGTDGGNNYYRGAGWYRRSLDVDAADLKADKRFYASLRQPLARRRSLRERRTRRPTSRWLLRVLLRRHGSPSRWQEQRQRARRQFPRRDIAPQSGDFTVFGGLYREVELLVLDPLHIAPNR